VAVCNLRFSFEEIQEMRRLHETGEATVRQIAERFKTNRHYVYEIIAGSVRQHANARRPKLVIQPMHTQGRLTDPLGNSFPRRGRIPRYARQIPFRTVVMIRHAYEQNGMSLADVATTFGVSKAHAWRIIRREARVSE
jgi:transposase-like protein